MDLLIMDEQQLVDKITKDFKKAEDARAPYELKWKKNYRLYKNKLEKLKEGRANLFIPYTWATVEQLKTRAMQALFSKPPYCGYAGVGEDDTEGAALMEKLVQYQMKEKIKLPYKFIFAFTSIFNYGTAIILDQWKHKEKNVTRRRNIFDPLTRVKTGEELTKQLMVLYDDPDVEFIAVDDFYPDPEGYDIDSCAYCCTRADRSLEYLREMEKQEKYKLPDDVEYDIGDTVTNFRDEINGVPSLDSYDKKKTYELITYYTDDYKIVLLNRKHIIYKGENDSWDKEKPFTRIVAFPNEKEFWGEAIVSIIASLQEELNATRNQRIDNVSLILNKVFKKRRGADIDTEEDGTIKIYGGKVIEMEDTKNDLQTFDIPDVTNSAYIEEDKIKQDIQYATGVSELQRGATPQRKETATTVNNLQEASNIFFNYIVMVIELTGLLPIGDKVKKLNQQYVTEQKVIRLFNAAKGSWDYQPIDPQAIQGNYDVVSVSPRLEAQQTKEAKRADLKDLFVTFAGNPVTQQMINIPEFVKRILDTYDIKDYEKLINTPQPLVPGQIPMPGGQTIIPGQSPAAPNPQPTPQDLLNQAANIPLNRGGIIG